jgi:signal transduction histidine kinase
VLLETSILSLNKDSGDLNRTIQSVIKYLSPMKKFYTVTFNTELNQLPTCKYDSEQIQHLFVHLFTNSVEAKRDATISIKSYLEDDKIVLDIEDNGPGFPEAIKNDPFGSKVDRKGSYGLFLCKSIIDRHKAEMKILDSKTGTKIRITLPVN